MGYDIEKQQLMNHIMDDAAKGFLEHHGIIGQKWGIRRYQNYDGTLTEEGKERYGKSLFVSGSSKTQDPDSPYYRKNLPNDVQNELKIAMTLKQKILVGDAPGIDRQTQDFLKKHKYENVEVFGPGTEVRYLADKKWKTTPVDAPQYEVGSKEWLAEKDKKMTELADYGYAVILDEGAKATRKNVERLLSQNKDVMVFSLSKDGSDDDQYVDAKSINTEDKK